MPFLTIAEAVAKVPSTFPKQTYTFQDANGIETTLDMASFDAQIHARAAGLQALGLSRGDTFGLIVLEPQHFVLSFLAATRVGIVPIPLYPPMSMGNIDSYLDRNARILANAGAKRLVASERLHEMLQPLEGVVPTLQALVSAEALGDSNGTPDFHEVSPDDLCFLQYTSGSTSDPKGVMVTHGNLVANCMGIATHLQLVGGKDVSVSWLPLYHDMGLIGMLLTPMMVGVSTVFIPTLRFIRRPNCWMDAMHRHRGSISFAPNFAYGLAMRRAKESVLGEWDLSCVRVLGCGAEPIHPETMREFTQIFSEGCAMPANAIMPAYGMAEATLAISLKPLHDAFETRVVGKKRFEADGLAIEAASEEEGLEHVACGAVLPGHQVQVLDEKGQPLPDGFEGELCVRGPSVTVGYYGNPVATEEAFRFGWLHTGDLGYVHEGQVYITGRRKDLIILNGRNLHPQSIEWAVGDVEGVRSGSVVAFSVPSEHSERLVLVVETRLREHDALIETVRKRVQNELSVVPDQVVCARPGAVFKTSSGKLQRRKTRQAFLDGVISLA